MYSLFIDTHDKNINIVLYEDQKVLVHERFESLKNHSIYVMPLIKKVIETQKINKKDIKQLIVVSGPGSFTGVRLGITIAKTWAYVEKIPIKVLSYFEVMMASIKIDNIKYLAIRDSKGSYLMDTNNLSMYYLNNSNLLNLDNILFEEDVVIDYERVYNYTLSKETVNPHSIKPLYIKKIGVGND